VRMSGDGGTRRPAISLADFRTIVGEACRKCGKGGGLYIVETEFVVLCTPCVADRIAVLRRNGNPLPSWLDQLEQEVGRELEQLRREAERAYRLTWDDLYRCARCSRMIHRRDARYPVTTVGTAVSPHCIPCCKTVRPG
jgi:hypothetical protein